MRHLQTQTAEFATGITSAKHFADVLFPARLGAHHARRRTSAARRIDQGRADMPHTVASQDGRAQRRGLFNTNADRQPGQHPIQRLEIDNFRQRIELGPGEDFHHLALERTGIDFQWHLPGVFGERRRQQLDPLIKHERRVAKHLLVIEGPHHRRHRVFARCDVCRVRGHG
ncbi:hypothetical protein D3C84_808820 [compost metagenome]